MFKNYLKTIIRNFKRQKMYSFINITGLAIGIACTILIMLWVHDEMSYDQFHGNIDNIYWMTEWSRGENCWGSVTALGPALQEEYPEIINYARNINGDIRFLFQYKEKSFFEEMRIGDFSLFEIFTFPIINGSFESGKIDPHVIILSQKMATKYFGNDDPLGKHITIDKKYDLKVVGVFKDMPHNSTIKFNCIAPLEFADIVFNRSCSNNWADDGNQTYVQLQKNTDYKEFNTKLKNFYTKHDKEYKWPVIYPYKKYYLAAWGRNHADNVQILSLIAFFILIIACSNFMNLSTARSAHRTKEVGLRKVIGAQKKELIKQFFMESIVFAFIGTLISIFIVTAALPQFREITGKPISAENLLHIKMITGIIAITLITGILSGSYPALFLSSFSPAVVLKGFNLSSFKKTIFRKILVIGQFIISIGLIGCTLLVYKQINYLKNSNWGFEKENIIYFHLEGKLKQNYGSLKNELLSNPQLINVTATSHTPGAVWYGNSGWKWEGKNPDLNLWSRVFNADPDFLTTFNMEMAEGTFFEKIDNNIHQVIINEKFAQEINVSNPVGKYIWEEGINNNIPSKIVGIIKNYHIAPFYYEIHPLIIFPNFKWGKNWMNYNYMFIKIKPGQIESTVSFIKKTVQKHNPDYPFNYQFYNSYFNQLYHPEQMMDKLLRGFAILAIIISALGLFGLASFTAEKRRKEIGIRKTLGATIPNIMFLMSKEFIKWIVISNLIAWPIGWYVMRKWLQDFAYRTDIELWIFPAAGLLALLIAVLTVSYQVIKAARVNPVKSLRYE